MAYSCLQGIGMPLSCRPLAVVVLVVVVRVGMVVLLFRPLAGVVLVGVVPARESRGKAWNGLLKRPTHRKSLVPRRERARRR